MKYYRLTIEECDKLPHPNNCEIWIMEKNKDGDYKMKIEHDV